MPHIYLTIFNVNYNVENLLLHKYTRASVDVIIKPGILVCSLDDSKVLKNMDIYNF